VEVAGVTWFGPASFSGTSDRINAIEASRLPVPAQPANPKAATIMNPRRNLMVRNYSLRLGNSTSLLSSA
jgi:hypothetical protein